MIKDRIDSLSFIKKAVIVANGPSTKDQDWDTIKKTSSKNTIFLACNRINLIFNSTSWRPDIYTCFATNALQKSSWINSVDACLSNKETTSFISNQFKKVSKLKQFHKNVVFCDNILEHHRNAPINKDFLNVDLSKGILKSYSATAPLFQICDYLNVESIAIIGQDGYIFDEGENHFHEKYQDEPANYKKTNIRLKSLHSEFKRYFNKKKVKIYNSSPESIIQDIYEFVDLQKFAEKDLGQVA